MGSSYDQNYFGDEYYNFKSNQNNGFQDMNQFRPQMRPQFVPKQDTNYGQNNNIYGNNNNIGLNSNTNNYYRRTQHPYYGQQTSGPSIPRPNSGQYRAQVIDYSGPQSQTNEAIPRMPLNRFPNDGHQFRPYNSINSNSSPNNSSQHLMTTPQTNTRPPRHPYPNIRVYGQPMNSSPNRALLPIPAPNQMVGQRFRSYPPIPQTMNYSQTNQSFNQNNSQPLQQLAQHFPKPVPQPVPPPPPQVVPLPVPPVVNKLPIQTTQPLITTIKVEADLQSQRILEEKRINKISSEGMKTKLQNDLRGFYCLFCESFCVSLTAAERHVESPKHQRTKIGDNLKGIDAKFTIKTERISEMEVALARKEELNRISNVIKNDYYNEGIRLKDGIGSDAYICENCGLSLDSLSSVTKHLETHKQFSDQLKICSKPVIGLDFIVEYIDPQPSKGRVYECTMCHSFYSTREIISHVCSYEHRTSFIRRIHPSEGLKYNNESQQLSLEAGKRALELETLIGRGQFKVKHMAAPTIALNEKKSVVSSDYNYNDSDDRVSTPTQKVSKPMVQIDFPKQKSEQEKTELEKLFSVRLESESEANEVTQLISQLTQSVIEYHMKEMTPQMRTHFQNQFNDK